MDVEIYEPQNCTNKVQSGMRFESDLDCYWHRKQVRKRGC